MSSLFRAHREAVPVHDPGGISGLLEELPRDGGGWGGKHAGPGPDQASRS